MAKTSYPEFRRSVANGKASAIAALLGKPAVAPGDVDISRRAIALLALEIRMVAREWNDFHFSFRKVVRENCHVSRDN
ncbi:MAG: hypothetical protein ACO1RA_17340 [Planctomycetaceae bacterium]